MLALGKLLNIDQKLLVLHMNISVSFAINKSSNEDTIKSMWSR